MNKKIRNLLLIGLLTATVISVVVVAYAISKKPEADFVQRMEIPQLSFADQTTFDAAADELALQEEAFTSKEITLTSSRGQLTITLKALGVDPETEAIQSYLRSFMTDATALDKIRVYLFGQTLDVSVIVDETALKQAFAESGIEQGQKNAEFTYDSTVIIVPEQIGYGIDMEALTAQLQGYWDDAFKVPLTAELPLRSGEPEVLGSELEPLLETAQKIAGRTLTLQDEFGSTWTLNMVDHVDWIIPSLPEVQADAAYTWAIDENKFVIYVETDLSPEVESDPQPATITENEDGTFTFEGSARFGKEIIKKELQADIFNTLQAEPTEETKDLTIELPVTHEQPVVTVPDSPKERGITELVGVGYSTYKSSPANRIANVNHGFEHFNGMFVEQGAEFSFTELMGPIDAAHGWLPELVIKGDETIPEYGGGMCQVSSTMFRAALYSGLPITQRKNHSYAVSYYAYPYGYGLDATVYDPNPNLKFVNDTPGDLLIQGYTDGFDAYFVFYGTNDGRTVKMEGPYSYGYTSAAPVVTSYSDNLEPGVRVLEEYGHTGFKVDWYRTVVYTVTTADSEHPEVYVSPYAASASGVRENIHSDYEARPAKYTEGKSTDGIEE